MLTVCGVFSLSAAKTDAPLGSGPPVSQNPQLNAPSRRESPADGPTGRLDSRYRTVQMLDSNRVASDSGSRRRGIGTRCRTCTFLVAGAGLNLRPLGRSGLPARHFGMSLVSFGCLDLHGDQLAADVATVPVASGRLGPVRVVPDGYSMGISMGRLNRETCPEEVSAPVVAGCLLVSRTVFEHFGVLDIDPESTVDSAPVEAHLRCMTTWGCGMDTALFSAAATMPAVARSPRSRGLTGTVSGAEDSSAPDAQSAEMRAMEIARWCRFGTTVHKPTGRTVPLNQRQRGSAPGAGPLSNQGQGVVGA